MHQKYTKPDDLHETARFSLIIKDISLARHEKRRKESHSHDAKENGDRHTDGRDGCFSADLACLSVDHEMIELIFIFEGGHPNGEHQIFILDIVVGSSHMESCHTIRKMFAADLAIDIALKLMMDFVLRIFPSIGKSHRVAL